MKFLLSIILLALCLASPPASASTRVDLFCAYDSAMKYKDIVKFEQFAKDKYRHCTISCIIGLECGVTSSAIVGMAKEIFDVFGPGNAEWEDLIADIWGLRISRRTSVYNLDTCSSACQEFYPL